jgi:hypothetical protein
VSARKQIIALAVTTVLTVGQSALAQEPAGDSAYQWGRWAVLSPAAGGEPFRAPDDPGAEFNVRPGEFYGPEVQSTLAPPVNPPITDPGDRPRPTPPPIVNDPGDRPRPAPPPS